MLEMVSKERICSELSIILSTEWANEIVTKMEELGVLKAISGNLMEKSECPLGINLEVNLALLCREFEGDGSQLREILRKELVLSNSVLEEVGFLHDCKEEKLEINAPYIRRFAAALPDRRKKNILDYLGTLGQDTVTFSKAMGEVGNLRFGASPIVDGNELSRKTGLVPGPRLGMLKGWLYRRQVEDDLTTFDEVIGLLDDFNWENSEPADWGKMEWP